MRKASRREAGVNTEASGTSSKVMERFGKNAFAHASMLSHARTHTPVLRLRRLYSLIGLESVSDSCIYP